MRNTLLILILALVSCQQTEKGFLTYRRSYSGRLYFFSKENDLDRSRKVFVLCADTDSALTFSRYEVLPFDSLDYFQLDETYTPNHMPDAALKFPGKQMSTCMVGIGVQLHDDFTVVSRRSMTFDDIVNDPRLSVCSPDCKDQDRAELFELKTIGGERYYVYDVRLSRQCEYSSSDLLLFHNSTLINRQTSY